MARVRSLIRRIGIPLGALIVLIAVLSSCSEAADDPVSLAEAHIEALNRGDVEQFLAWFAEDTPVAELGTRGDPAVRSAVAFLAATFADTEGFVAECEPWGRHGAQCEGSVRDRLYAPAGLRTSVTVVYVFDEADAILRMGTQVVHELEDYRYEREFAAWIQENHPGQAAALTEYGLLRHSGDTAEELLALVEPFLAQSEHWPRSDDGTG